MSTRIHRAIGWGLTWPDFLALQRLGVTEEALDETLETRFTDAGDDGLTVPEEVARALWDHPPPRGFMIVERRLLALASFIAPGAAVPLGQGYELYSLVRDGDRPLGILFYPTLERRARWHHFDDDVDYAFERWRAPWIADVEPRSLFTPVRYGHHPWTNDLMDAQGHPVAWDERAPDTLPAVPAEIRWYLAHLGILDGQGLLALRPVIAQWWA